jgi:hypothetical protein
MVKDIISILSQIESEDTAHFFATIFSIIMIKVVPCLIVTILSITILVLQVSLLIKKNKLVDKKLEEK